MIVLAALLFVVISAVLMVFAFLVMNSIVKVIKEIDDSIANMSDGDFVSEVKVNSNIKEFNNIAGATDSMREKVKDALLKVVGHADAVNTGADVTEDSITKSRRTTGDISTAIDEVANGATSMAQDVQDTSSIAVDMGYAVGNVIDAANANLQKGRSVYDESMKVQSKLEELKRADQETDRMAGEVAESVNETAQVVEDISNAAKAIIGIAQQTNLLALNASIEAARAGDAGRGFAVVAENIGGLAAESNQTAGQITEMLGRITTLSDRNKELTNNIKEATSKENVALEEMFNSFDGMLVMLKETEAGNNSIMELAASLDDAKNKITTAVESLSSISEENAASTQETNSSVQLLNANMENIVAEAQNLKAIATELRANIGFFKLE
ncbi:MAG: methyl-accepting chemotaxis protein [Lachnospiraceae bacterium]|nr:methyl-accepting chemotaxis protein [Lachnospiraceae bacterium]